MDSTVSGLGASSNLIESSMIDRVADQSSRAAAGETRHLVSFAAEMRGAASTATSSSAASVVNPGNLAAELLKRLDPFLEKARVYGRIAVPDVPDELARTMPIPSARGDVVLANLDPADIHPGPARKSFGLPVPKIEGEIEGRIQDRAFGGTIDSFYDNIIADLFGSDEHFRQWSNDMIGEAFKHRIFDIELGLIARGLRGATDAISTLTRQS